MAAPAGRRAVVRVFLFFVDGVGLGAPDPRRNPFLRARLPVLTAISGGQPGVAFEGVRRGDGGAVAVATDACLGVAGLPQSATGQTTILTGVNAAAALGRHVNGHPTPTLARILAADSLFRKVLAAGYTAAFLNAYRPAFFEVYRARLAHGGWSPSILPRDRRYRPSASTLAVDAAGLRFRSLADVRAGRAIYHDITNETLAEASHSVSVRSPEEAGHIAAALAATYDLVFFEYFRTDLAGHARDLEGGARLLETVDRFLAGLLAGLDPSALFVLCSDHGNLEDCSVKTHTRNPVATVFVGRGAERWARRVTDLTDLAPLILDALRT
ncbi:MAG: peptidase [Clostridia bacterium]|nr:peptidase [Clostridia bacterium]